MALARKPSKRKLSDADVTPASGGAHNTTIAWCALLLLVVACWMHHAGDVREASPLECPLGPASALEVHKAVWRPLRESHVGTLETDPAGPDFGELHLVDKEKYPLAMCLDGSPASFYVRQAPKTSPNASKWVLHFQGGHQCEVHESNSTVKSCHRRAQTEFGSSRFDEKKYDLGSTPIMSSRASLSPTWHDWNVVMLRYCDGMNWIVTLQESVDLSGMDPLFFRGGKNVEAIVDTLLHSHGMDMASDVIVYGCSAGGVGAIVHADRIRAMLSNSSFYAVISDGAYLPDFSHQPGHKNEDVFSDSALLSRLSYFLWPLQFRENALDLVGESPSHENKYVPSAYYRDDPLVKRYVDPACVASLTERFSWEAVAVYLCHVPYYAIPHVTAPLFILTSKHDTTWLPFVSVSNPVYLWMSQLVTNKIGHHVGESLLQRVSEHDRRHPDSPLGVVIDSCAHHCDWWGKIRFSDGRTNADTFADWYQETREWWEGESGVAPKVRLTQNRSFPCESCCETPLAVSVEHQRLLREFNNFEGGRDLTSDATSPRSQFEVMVQRVNPFGFFTS